MIRPAVPADLPELMRLAFEFHKAAHLKRYATFEDSEAGWSGWLSACIENTATVPTLCLIAEHEGKVVGFLTGAIYPVFWNPEVKIGHETAMWVDPGARGQGLGRGLLATFAEWARGRGAARIGAGSTMSLNPKAMDKMLRGAGFVLEEKHYSWRGAA